LTAIGYANPNVGTVGFNGRINPAILRYFGANTTAAPTTTSSTSNLLAEMDLHPLENHGAQCGSAEADVKINLAFAFNIDLEFTVNGATFIPPTVPFPLQVMSGAEAAPELSPFEDVYTLPDNSVVEISVPGGSVGAPVSTYHLLQGSVSLRAIHCC